MRRASCSYPNCRGDLCSPGASPAWNSFLSEKGRAQLAPTVSRIIQQFKGAVTKRIGISVWQKGFYDHIIRNESDYLRIWQYIDTNPAKWQEDCYYTP